MFWMMISWCYFWQSLGDKFWFFVTDPGSDWSHLAVLSEISGELVTFTMHTVAVFQKVFSYHLFFLGFNVTHVVASLPDSVFGFPLREAFQTSNEMRVVSIRASPAMVQVLWQGTLNSSWRALP